MDLPGSQLSTGLKSPPTMSFVFASIWQEESVKKEGGVIDIQAINTGNTVISVVDFYVNDNTSRIRVIISRHQVEELWDRGSGSEWEQTLDCLFYGSGQQMQTWGARGPVCEISINIQYQCKCP